MFDLPSSWYGLSSNYFYKEVLFLPVAILVLWFVWMKLVAVAFREEASGEGGPKTISLEEAYLDALVNEEMLLDEAAREQMKTEEEDEAEDSDFEGDEEEKKDR